VYRQFTKKAGRKLPTFPVISPSVLVRAVLAALRVRQEPRSALPDKALTGIHRAFEVALSSAPQSFPCRRFTGMASRAQSFSTFFSTVQFRLD
jgi:hypothetical protein